MRRRATHTMGDAYGLQRVVQLMGFTRSTCLRSLNGRFRLRCGTLGKFRRRLGPRSVG